MWLLQLLCTILSLGSAWASGSLFRWSWVLTFIASVVNAFMYLSLQRYGHAFLDLIYMICSLVGFSLWSGHNLMTYRISFKEAVLWIVTGLAATILCVYILEHSPSKDPWIDSFSLVSGVIGIIMMTLLRIEQWVIWVIHDIFNLVLSLRAGLYIIALKQAAYIILAYRGYKIWRKQLSV